MKIQIVTVTLSILLCASARAELKWEQTQLELHPAVGDKEAVGHFKYKNTGNTPIHFKSVHSSCGCTTAQSQKDQVAPGDSGEITATFNIGDRTGTQVKSVTAVSTDFQVKVNKVGEGEFKIEVQPRDTTRPAATTFAIQPDNSPKAFYLSARVINSPPPVTTAVKP